MQKLLNDYRRVTEEQVALIHELFHQGMSRIKISKATRIAPHLLNEFIIEKAFYFEKGIGRNTLSDEEIDLIYSMADKGYTNAAISKKVGCSPTTVQKYLIK